MRFAWEHGFELVEIILEGSLHPLRIGPMLNEIRRTAASLGLRLRCHAPFYSIDLASFADDVRQVALTEILDALEVAAKLDADVLTVHPGLCFLPCELMRERALETLLVSVKRIIEHAEELSLVIGLETRGERFSLGAPADLLYILRRIGSEHLGVTYDTAQAFKLGDPLRVLREVSAYIVHVHVRDVKPGVGDALAVGDGVIAWRDLLAELARYYTGPLVIEVMSEEDALKSACKLRELSRLL